MTRAKYVADRLKSVLTRRGTTVTIRRQTSLDGSIPTPNPPRAKGLVLSSAASPGDTVLHLGGDSLSDRVVRGDLFVVGGQRLVATADAIAANNIAAITVQPGFTAAHTAGTSVTAIWINDIRVTAGVAAYSRRLVDGTLIEARDYAITVSATSLPAAPTEKDLVIFSDGEVRKIVSITPQFIEGVAASYVLQAR